MKVSLATYDYQLVAMPLEHLVADFVEPRCSA